MEKDFDQLNQLQMNYPQRVNFMRFEDFATNPRRELLEVVEFFNLPATEEMEAYLNKRVGANGQLLAQNADTSSNAWQSEMHFSSIEQIQKTCLNAMSKWGYKLFTYEDVHPNRAVLPIEIQPNLQENEIKSS